MDFRRRDVLAFSGLALLPVAEAAAALSPAAHRMATDLDRQVAGAVLVRGDALYDRARRQTWSAATPDRFPDFVVRAASEDDVVTTIRFARRHGLKVALRGGGHNWAYPSVRDGGILLDLGGLDDFAIDPVTRTATVCPGVSGGAFLTALSRHGLSFPIAHCPSVPMSGFILNGGYGWNTGTWGTAAANVIAMDMVTADGRLIRASANENEDLYWAARGAGPGFFAAVTRFHVTVFPDPDALSITLYAFPLDAAEDVARWADDLADDIPADVEFSYLVSAGMPPHGPESLKLCMVSGIAFADTDDRARDALAFMKPPPPVAPLMSMVEARTDFNALLSDVAGLFPPRARYIGNCMWTASPLAAYFPDYARHLATAPSAKSFSNSVIYPTPAQGAVPMPDAAMALRDRALVLWYAIWDDAGDDAANRAWYRAAADILQPHATGFYIGETDLVHFPDNARRSYRPDHWVRLRTLRRRYDPDGLFFDFWGQADGGAS